MLIHSKQICKDKKMHLLLKMNVGVANCCQKKLFIQPEFSRCYSSQEIDGYVGGPTQLMISCKVLYKEYEFKKLTSKQLVSY